MATISVENAVVKGHHVYLSEVRIRDIFDCFPEMDNLDRQTLEAEGILNEVQACPS